MFVLSSLTERLFIALGKGPTLDERTLVQAGLWFAIANAGIFTLLCAPGFDMHWIVGAMVGYGLLLMLVTWAGALRWSIHGLLLLQFAQIAALSAHSGGINSPFIACMPLLPITAMLLLNMRWALVWMLIISIHNYFQYLAVHRAWIDGAVNPQTVSLNTILFVKINSLFFLLLALSLYDWTYRRKIHKLTNDNQELNRIEADLQKASTDIGAFTDCITHQICTPVEMQLRLNPILAAELANIPGHSDVALQLRADTSTLLQSVNDVLDLANLEIRRHAFSLSSFFLPDALQCAADAVTHETLTGRLPVQIQLDSSAQVWVHGDKARLTQAVSRLLACANQQAEAGNIEVSARFTDTRVSIEVQFSPQNARTTAVPSHMISNAAQAVQHLSPDLGLTVCERLATEAGGQFCVYRRGPTRLLLWLEWPLSLQAMAVSPPPPDAITAPASKRFLVIEHVLSSQLEIQSLLKNRWPQCHVGLAESAHNALLQMEFSRYDMVLINLALPQTDGFEATRQIRTHALPAVRTTPVIGLASRAQLNERHRCLASEMQWVLFKPLEADTFFAAITAHLTKESSLCI